jgi:hypothetical protein
VRCNMVLKSILPHRRPRIRKGNAPQCGLTVRGERAYN